MPESWENITVSCSEIEGVNYWIWRHYRRLEKVLKVNTTKGVFALRSKLARRQFLNHLGLSIRQIERERDWRRRNDVVAEAIKRREIDEKQGKVRKLVFRVLPDNEVWSVVTEDYVEVPVEDVVEQFENTLNAEGFTWAIKRQWDSGRAIYKVYELYYHGSKELRVGDVASVGIVLKIGYSGDRAVSLYGFYKILACENGLISKHSISAVKLIHRVSKEKILNGIRHAFKQWLAEYPQFAKLVDKARKIELTEEQEKEILDKILGKYPKHIRRRIMKLLETKYIQEHGLFKLSQAISDFATHYHITDNYRKQLQQDAYKILTIKPEVKK